MALHILSGWGELLDKKIEPCEEQLEKGMLMHEFTSRFWAWMLTYQTQ